MALDAKLNNGMKITGNRKGAANPIFSFSSSIVVGSFLPLRSQQPNTWHLHHTLFSAHLLTQQVLILSEKVGRYPYLQPQFHASY